MNNSSSSSSSSYFIDENNNNNYEQQEEEKVLQYLNDYDGHVVAKTPVERLLELKYNKADPLQMVQGLQTGFGTKFNQLKTNNLSPTRATIDESSLLKTFNYVNNIQANIYNEITKKEDDFFDALNEVIRAKQFPPGSVLPKITSPKRNRNARFGSTDSNTTTNDNNNNHKIEPQSPISMVVRKSIRTYNKNKSKTTTLNNNTRNNNSNRMKQSKKKRKGMRKKSKSMQKLDDNKIYSNPFRHARLLQKAMERRRKKEEQKFMKELEYLQQHILEEEKRRSQRLKDTRSAYSNANKFFKHERKYLQNASQERRVNDAEEAVKKVQYEKEVLAKRREEAQRDKEDMQKKKAEQMKEAWARRKKEREDRENYERMQREQVEKEKRREWQLMQQSEQRKEDRKQRERETKERKLREERRNEKYAQSMI